MGTVHTDAYLDAVFATIDVDGVVRVSVRVGLRVRVRVRIRVRVRVRGHPSLSLTRPPLSKAHLELYLNPMNQAAVHWTT